MYAVDITRTKDEISSDMLLGKDSMDAKRKIMDYVKDYALANYNLYIEDEVLDQNLNIDTFSFKNFIKNNYSIEADRDLMIQSFPTDKENCLFVKIYDEEKDEMPLVYVLNKDDNQKANSLMLFLIKDALIEKYEDDLDTYDTLQLTLNQKLNSYSHDSIRCEKISLYNGGMFLEELLNNACTLKQYNNKDLGGIDI